MFNAYHMYGGAALLKKLKIGASVTAGVHTIQDGSNNYGEVIDNASTSTAADTHGISLHDATYSTTQADTEGRVTVNIRSDAIMRARLSGGTTSGTALVTLSNTIASSGGVLVTDATNLTAVDFVSGTVWQAGGGESRVITTNSSGTSFTVTVPFSGAIPVGAKFHWAPQSFTGDGGGNMNLTSDFKEVDGIIVGGTGIPGACLGLIMRGATDSYIDFFVADHATAPGSDTMD